jgi:predicted nucleic acid-binding protein
MRQPSLFEKLVTDKVLDASVVVALLFNELTRESVVSRLRGASLYAPNLLSFEAANACLKKMRAAPAQRHMLLEAFALFPALSIELKTIYDATYLWLARTMSAELLTLDDRLARADAALRGSA